MKPTLLTAICCALFSAVSLSAADPSSLGEFDGHCDIGSPRNVGAATYNSANKEYEIAGSGVNMWGVKDECHFVWKRLKGDFVLRTRFEFVGDGAEPHRKVGWMVRPNLDADAPYADCVEHGNGLTSLQFRPAKGTNTQTIALAITNANVLQFERKGNSYVFSASHNGEPFVSKELLNFNLGDEVYAGLFVCAHNGDVIEKARFRDVRISPVRKP